MRGTLISIILSAVVLSTAAFADLNSDKDQAAEVYNKDYADWQNFEHGEYGGSLYWLTNAASNAYSATTAPQGHGPGTPSVAMAYINAARYFLVQATQAANSGIIGLYFPTDFSSTQQIVFAIEADIEP